MVSLSDDGLTAQLRVCDKILLFSPCLADPSSMTPSTPPSPAVTCAENIALLHLLHSVPDPPSRNPIDRLPVRQNGYTLSLLRERSLVGTLAFLSNLKDGPEHIPAVCVREGPESAFLSVLLAVNKDTPSDGEGVLQNLKLGFERIFALLSRVSDGQWPMPHTISLLISSRRRHSSSRGSGL